MLCIWWDQLGVVYYELLQPNETITVKRFQQQLMQVSRALKFKRPTVGQNPKNALKNRKFKFYSSSYWVLF